MVSQETKEKILSRLAQKVEKNLDISGNCAQSSFLALQEQFALDGGEILKALTPFPGLAFRGHVCGSVIGCVMALGLIYGRERLGDRRGYIHAIPPVLAFYRRFEKEVGSIMCYDIVESEFGEKFDGVEPVETKRWLEAGAIEKCTATAAKAVRIAAEIILDRSGDVSKKETF